LIVLSEDIVKVLFFRGEFDLEDLRYTSLVISGIVSALVFVFVLNLGVLGLALATTVNYYVALFYLYFFLPVGFSVQEVMRTLLKSSIANLFMILLIFGLKLYIKSSLLLIALSVPLGAVVYLFSLILFKEDSIKLLLSFKRSSKG